MAEQTYQSLPQKKSPSTTKQDKPSPSEPSSASDGKSTSSNLTRRRKQQSMSPDAASDQLRESIRQRQKPKTLPTRSRGESSRSSIIAMSGLLDQTGEITYTPTTHRISKAKKGKKVHACEFPGCTKVRYIAWSSQIRGLHDIRSLPEQNIASMSLTGSKLRITWKLTICRRHEANHNTSPAFQCDKEGCKKPFQRADLLARHMERQ